MLSRLIVLVVPCLAVVLAGCGGGSGNTPTAPTTSTPPPTTAVTPPVVTPPAPTVANFAGRWSGTYFVERCEGTGSAQDLTCSAPSGGRPGGAFPVGTALPITIELSQSGTNVSGTIAFGSVRGVTTGVVSSSTGLLTLQGTATPPSGGGSATITYWSTRVQQNAMDGFVNFDLRLPTFPGVASVYARLGTVTR